MFIIRFKVYIFSRILQKWSALLRESYQEVYDTCVSHDDREYPQILTLIDDSCLKQLLL